MVPQFFYQLNLIFWKVIRCIIVPIFVILKVQSHHDSDDDDDDISMYFSASFSQIAKKCLDYKMAKS